MTQFNSDIADMLASRFRDLTFEKDGTSGYAVADKSYGFDTIYLAARFISRFSREDTITSTSSWPSLTHISATSSCSATPVRYPTI